MNDGKYKIHLSLHTDWCMNIKKKAKSFLKLQLFTK